MKITARKVAQDLGLSTATVSLAINNRPGVNEETKKKILDYMKLLEADYETMVVDGKSLKMLIYFQENFQYRASMKDFSQSDCALISRLLQGQGMNLKLCYASSQKEMEKIILESEHDGTVGILLSLDEAPADILQNLPESKVPLLMYDTPLPPGRSDCDVINLHDRQGVCIAMDYLRRCGHENIVYFSNEESIYNFEMRRKAFRQYLIEWKGKFPEGSIVKVGGIVETREEGIEKYLNSVSAIPDAIVAENFKVSLAVMSVLKKKKMVVPKDISVLGIDDPKVYEYTEVDFTCIDVPIYERHEVMLKQFLGRLNEKKHYPQEISLGMRLKKGSTVQESKGQSGL